MATKENMSVLIGSPVFKALRKRRIHFRKHYHIPNHYGLLGGPWMMANVALPSNKKAVCFKHKVVERLRDSNLIPGLAPRSWDKKNFSILCRIGWKIMVVWNDQLDKNEAATISRVLDFIKNYCAPR